ncbi:hypothetical protein [Thalassovita mangrovi]|uniref:hypothetical protein n=1 Tax=Thalassovita mangrovi TaxID=2692236 RepID=UPI00136FC669|nr:hypothetical protein [Thalassovita mangrovi]
MGTVRDLLVRRAKVICFWGATGRNAMGNPGEFSAFPIARRAAGQGFEVLMKIFWDFMGSLGPAKSKLYVVVWLAFDSTTAKLSP